MRWLPICVLLSFFSPSAQAEYRAFLLKITAPNGQDFRLVTSNLDPEQYPTYYPLRPGEKIQYTETWMCRGRTNETHEICENPKRAPAQSPTAAAPAETVPESPSKSSDSKP